MQKIILMLHDLWSMSIVTKTGDAGTTALFGGTRVHKSDDQIAAYGAVDELTSFLGLTHAKLAKKEDKELVSTIQSDLYQIMASLANYPKASVKSLGDHIGLFEQLIDKLENQLPKLTSFILPQGGEVATLFHVSRTVCRRAERDVVGFFEKKLRVTSDELRVMRYLNRLSDLLFMLARKYSVQETKAKQSR